LGLLHLGLDLLLNDRLLGVEAEHPVEGVHVLKRLIEGAAVAAVAPQVLQRAVEELVHDAGAQLLDGSSHLLVEIVFPDLLQTLLELRGPDPVSV
jgi:hypothetical protein